MLVRDSFGSITQHSLKIFLQAPSVLLPPQSQCPRPPVANSTNRRNGCVILKAVASAANPRKGSDNMLRLVISSLPSLRCTSPWPSGNHSDRTDQRRPHLDKILVPHPVNHRLQDFRTMAFHLLSGLPPALAFLIHLRMGQMEENSSDNLWLLSRNICYSMVSPRYNSRLYSHNPSRNSLRSGWI